MSTETQLDVRGLEKQFGDEFALSAVDLTVGSDEIVALLGPSGCGKTTILRCIAGVETPESGTIRIGDEVVYDGRTSLPPERRDVGMVYQSYAIWPHKSVYENVVFPLKHTDHSIPSGEYESRVDEILELLEIQDLKRSPATDLSGGQQQRTALARSLVHDPDLLLLDEPLSNLDRELRTNMRYELQRLQHELDISMLYVTHDQEEAFYLADTVVIVKDGGVVEEGPPRELYRRPRSAFTRGFVGNRNRVEGTVDTEAGDRVVRTDLAAFPVDRANYVGDDRTTGPVSCFVRPGDISIGAVPDGGADGTVQLGDESDAAIGLRGEVVAEGIIGDQYEVTVTFDGHDTDLIVHTENASRLEPGDGIALRIPTDSIQVYPATDR
jgi:ABC-type Fe3+/spermidine/putrescine transport system ATPase subunit